MIIITTPARFDRIVCIQSVSYVNDGTEEFSVCESEIRSSFEVPNRDGLLL